MNRLRVFVFLVTFLHYVSCQSPEDYGCFGEGGISKTDLRHLARKSENFTFEFFKDVAIKNKEFNAIMAPYSIWGAMTLVYYGSNGATRDQLQSALGYDSVSDGYQNGNDLRARNGNLPGIKYYELTQVHFDLDLNLRPCIYYAVPQLKKTNFSDHETAKEEINNAIARTTRGNIPTFVKGTNLRGGRFILINVVYFKGDWCFTFNKRLTSDRPFYDYTGKVNKAVTQTMVMNGPVKLKNTKLQDSSVVILPYRMSSDNECERFSMWIILPNKGVSVDQTLSTLTVNLVQSIENFAIVSDILVVMPKFNMTTKIAWEAREALQAQGVVDVFDENLADLTNFVPRDEKKNVYLQAVLHQATIEVNEEGTISPAQSALSSLHSSANRNVMVVNRPFIFLIRDSINRVTLFTAVVRNVTALND